MPISTIGQNGLNAPITLTSPVINNITSASATNLTLQSAGTTAITVTTSQNVGISTTPNAWTSAFKAIQFPSYGSAFQKTTASSEFALGWNIYAGTNATNINDSMYYKNTGDVASMYSIGGAHTWWTAGAGTAGNLISWTQSMTLSNSGIFLVGTTTQTPGYGNTNTGAQLSNNGSHFSRAATDWVMTVNQNTADGSARYLIGFRVSNGQVGNIQSNGTNCTYNSNSDYRLKENIAPMTGALAKVAQLKPVTYKWKVDGSDGEGFIAHELAEVVPECVTGVKDAVDAEGNPVYQGIDTSFLVATLTAAIQELKTIVDAQAAEIAELKAKVA